MTTSSPYALLVFDWEGTLMNGGEPFPGVPEVLAQLQAAGYVLSIATGKSRRGLEQDLSRYDLASFFDAYRCGDEGFSKPNPEMLTHLLSQLDVPPDGALVIGDTDADMLMAQNAEVDALAVTYGYESKERLLSLSPRGYIDDIIELPRWLEENPPPHL